MRSEFWIISTLISIGVIGGIVYNWPTQPLQHGATGSPDSNPPPLENESSPISELRDRGDPFKNWQLLISRGDNYLVVGNFNESLDHYLAVYKAGHKQPQIEFRIALAYELAGQGTHADFFYRRVLQAQQVSHRLREETFLAQTRNWAEIGRKQEASDFLAQQFLSSDFQQSASDDLRFQVEYQLVQLFQDEARTLFERQIGVLDQPYFAKCPLDVERVLAAIGPFESSPVETGGGLKTPLDEVADVSQADRSIDELDEPSVDGPTGTASGLRLLQRPGDHASLMVVEGTVAPAALSRLLLDLQEITGLSFVTNADAQPFLIGRTVKIQSKAVSLAVLMDVVFRPLNLFWEQTGTEIHLRPVSSLAPAELAVVRAQQAIRLTRQIVINFPNHDCRNSLRVSAANFELLNGQYDAAATAYNQLLQEQQAGEINAALQLNLGLLEKKLHRLESAVELYFRAVDQSADNALKAIAYANIAQINIELGHTEPAIQAAARSLTLTSNGTVRVAAALDLARAYLINRDPLSANRVLFENATFFEALPQRKLSSVLAAYGRSLGTLSPVAKSKAVETLLIALADITPSELNFSVDKILVAKAYASIGLPDRAIDILSREPGPDENVVWRRRRLFELAQMLNQTGARDLAASQFRLVAENLGDVIGMWSQLELARIQLLVKKDPQSCLDLCRKLWLLDLPETIKSNTLNLMGQAYREIGDLDSSVFCFYGMLPHAHSLTAQSVSEDEQ